MTPNASPNKPKHEPRLGCFIYLLAAMAATGGFLSGYDTGIISSAMLYVPHDEWLKPMGNVWREVIVAITPGMAGISALCAGKLSDIYGRRRLIILSCLLFLVGALARGLAISKWTVLFGRILLGMGIGITTMVVPIYVGEASPDHIRGRLVTSFQLMVNFGLMSANIFAIIFSYINPISIGWRLMMGFTALPALFQLIGCMFLPESPRWLYESVGQGQTEAVLERIYNRDKEWISYEMKEIRLAHRQELKDKALYGNGNVLARIFATPYVRRALLVGCALHAFQQLSGFSIFVHYRTTVIRSAGVQESGEIQDNQNTILVSLGTGALTFLITFVPLYLVERVGRRVLLLASVFGVLCSLCLLGGIFLLINLSSAKTLMGGEETFSWLNRPVTSWNVIERCQQHSNCDYCVTDEHCGFCTLPNKSAAGFCYPKDSLHPAANSTVGQCKRPKEALHKTQGLIDNETYKWSDTYCHTQYTALFIISMLFYLCCFSVGYGPLAWVLNAEFYPLWARGTCVAIATFCSWAFNVLVSLTFLSLRHLATKYGTFFIYAAFTACALVYFYFHVPETKDQSIDEIQQVFVMKEERKAKMASSAPQYDFTPAAESTV